MPGVRRTRTVALTALVGAVLLATLGLALAARASVDKPPQITISTPKDGEVVQEPSVEVKGTFTVAPFNGPSPKVSATLNGAKLEVGVEGSVKYDFQGTATLKKGSNTLTVEVDDGNGGKSSKSVTVRYVPVVATKSQCATDRRGDSHDHFTHMDLVRACASRRGGKVIFSVTTAHRPPHIHDSFGNPAAPCFEIFRGAPLGHGGPAPIQSCGDAQLRGYTKSRWPKVPFRISGKTSTWKVPIKYLPKGEFEWRAYVADGYHYGDKAPDKGFLTFILK